MAASPRSKKAISLEKVTVCKNIYKTGELSENNLKKWKGIKKSRNIRKKHQQNRKLYQETSKKKDTSINI